MLSCGTQGLREPFWVTNTSNARCTRRKRESETAADGGPTAVVDRNEERNDPPRNSLLFDDESLVVGILTSGFFKILKENIFSYKWKDKK
jgi:hypothetical protein